MQMQQKVAARVSGRQAVPVAARTQSTSGAVRGVQSHVSAPVLRQPTHAASQNARTSVVSSALGNGSIAAPGPATPLNVVFVSAEVSPWSKTGGLGDVVGGLPVELAKRGKCLGCGTHTLVTSSLQAAADVDCRCNRSQGHHHCPQVSPSAEADDRDQQR
jgi:hypothetical protein